MFGNGAHAAGGIRRVLALALACVGAIGLATGCGGGVSSSSGESSPGVSKDAITIGGSYTLSGPLSVLGVFGPASKAYFESVNAKGGVDGHRIKFVYYDDAGDPSKVLQNTRRLVEQDNAFGIYSTVGNTVSASILDYVNQQRVPQLLAVAGGSEFGKTAAHPWTTPFYVGNATEGAVDGRFILSKQPNAKIGVLATNDDAGQSYVRGLEGALAGSGATIVAKQTYELTDATVDSQIAKLRASGADTVAILALAKFSSLGLKRIHELGWKPTIVLSLSASSRDASLRPVGFENVQGVYSAFFAKDPSDPQWANDPALKRYRDTLAQYGRSLDPNDAFTLLAYMNAQVLVSTLDESSALTRAAVNDAAHNLSLPTVDGLLPGISIKTGPGDPWPIETLQVVQFRGDQWVPVGDPVSYEGKTPN